MRHVLAGLLLLCGFHAACAAEPEPQAVAEQALAAVGGKDKLLRLFRIKEELVLGTGKPQVRTSILEPPDSWWLGNKQRAKPEPGLTAAWGWTLLPLVDPKSQLALLPETKFGEATAIGLRVSGSIDPPMDLYFDKESHLLLRLDWPKPGQSYVFSDWKEVDGVKYATKCVGLRNDKEWFRTQILELERLPELPAGLSR